MSRQIVLDTETTGLDPKQGHRIIEIGCVELINRRLTGNNYHQYINPNREIDEGAQQVHGLSTEFLQDKPEFKDIVHELKNYLDGAELIIHNAPFDVGFLDAELSSVGKEFGVVSDFCSITDTLLLARKKHPGQKNNLDALCKRYEVNNSQRELHGALLDAELLADVYLLMTGGQVGLLLSSESSDHDDLEVDQVQTIARKTGDLAVIKATSEELAEHESIMTKMGESCLWQK